MSLRLGQIWQHNGRPDVAVEVIGLNEHDVAVSPISEQTFIEDRTAFPRALFIRSFHLIGDTRA